MSIIKNKEEEDDNEGKDDDVDNEDDVDYDDDNDDLSCKIQQTVLS